MSLAQDVPVRPGDILAAKYRVEKVLGSGTMGVVVAAMHEDLRERRAIKFMLPHMLGDAEGVERFLREARAVVRLKSQHVAKIHDIGRLDTGAPYMVMEYLEGTDLKQLLQERGALPVHEAVGYLLQVCEAIAEAHALGIVHRDLKPANLFLTTGAGGGPCTKVLDFGIAKVSGPDAVNVTSTSVLLGTPLYMSPEQMRGATSVDGRSDIWALGAILYRMLTGRTPFSGSSVTEICAAVAADQPDPPATHRPEIPPALEAVVMRCLEKNPARRFATASELAAAIAPFAAPARPAAPPRSALFGTVIMAGDEAPVSARAGVAPASAPIPAVPMASAPASTPMPAAPIPAVPMPAAPASTPKRAAPVPAAPTLAATLVDGTTSAPTWTEARAPVARPPSSGKGLAMAAVAVALVAGGAALAAMRFAGIWSPAAASLDPAPSNSAVVAAPSVGSTAAPSAMATTSTAPPNPAEASSADVVPPRGPEKGGATPNPLPRARTPGKARR